MMPTTLHTAVVAKCFCYLRLSTLARTQLVRAAAVPIKGTASSPLVRDIAAVASHQGTAPEYRDLMFRDGILPPTFVIASARWKLSEFLPPCYCYHTTSYNQA